MSPLLSNGANIFIIRFEARVTLNRDGWPGIGTDLRNMDEWVFKQYRLGYIPKCCS